MFKFDSAEVERNVVPSMKQASNFLTIAKWTVLSISVPSDFSAYGRLRSIPSEIDNICYRVNQTKNGVTSLVNQISGAENKNKSLFDSIGGVTTGAYNFFGKMFSEAETGAKKVIRTSKKYLKNVISDSTVSFSKFWKDINRKAKTGCKIAKNGWNNVYKKYIKPTAKAIVKTGASIGNAVVSLAKGIGEFAQGLIKTASLVGTATSSIGTGVVDGITYLAAAINGNTSNWKSKTAEMWKGTMGFVSKNYVDNFFADFYKKNAIGIWLDKNAYEPFKSNSKVMNVISGVGYVAGIVALTFLTAGVGDAAIAPGTVASGFAGFAGIGTGTQNSWGRMREESWENVKEMYKKGEISKEQYNTFVQIRNLSDSEWKMIEKDYKNKKISKEQFEQMKKIREMPDDWKTLKNGVKGIGAGLANGAWEGIQYYLGGKIAGWALKGKPILTSGLRVGTDTLMGSLDTPYRSLINSLTFNESFKKEFDNQGGWKSVIMGAGIGLIASSGAEGLNLNKYFERNSSIKDASEYLYGKNKNQISDKIKVKLGEGIDAINGTNVLDGLDKDMAKNVRNEIMKKYVNGELSLNDLKTLDKSYGQSMQNRINAINSATKYIFKDVPINSSIKSKIEKGIDAINGTKVVDGLDKDMAENVRNEIMKKYVNGEISLNDIKTYDKSYGQYMQNRINSINSIKEYLFKDVPISSSVRDKIGKLVDEMNLNQRNITGGLDKETANKVRNILAEKYFRNKILLEDIKYFRQVDRIPIIGKIKLDDLSNFFSEAKKATGTFGVNQGIFRELNKNTLEYKQLINDLSKRYNMDKITVVRITDTIENYPLGEQEKMNPGICTYADACNILIDMFKDKPQDFEKVFGFKLYEQTPNGIKINQEKLLFDMYVTANLEENGGSLYVRRADGKIGFSNKSGTHYELQKYMQITKNLENYLKTKFKNVNLNREVIDTSNLTKENIIYNINKLTGEGKEVSLICDTNGGPINYICDDSVTRSQTEKDSSHIVKVIGTTDEGILVESWGFKALIKFEDIVGKEGRWLCVRDIKVS